MARATSNKAAAPARDMNPALAGLEMHLEMHNLQIIYDNTIEAVRDISLAVPKGKIVALLGANGAGKSTLLKAVSGILYTEEGEIENGSIDYEGERIDGLSPDAVVRRGLVQVPEGRRLFGTLTVEENLSMGGFLQNGVQMRRLRDEVYGTFPRLAERKHQIAGYLSGGEQQMVAIGRAMMAEPRFLALDEPSLGLAPLVIDEIFRIVERLSRQRGITILLVEQNANRALEIADYGYIMENGRVVLDGTSAELSRNEDVREFYLGFGGREGRRNMRDVKHYKRRKRWLS